MSLPVHPKSGPINRAAFLSGLGGTAAWQFWPMADSGLLQTITAGLCLAVALPSGVRTADLLVKDYKLRRDLARAAQASSDHGTAREAEWHELVARGMDQPASGNLLGLHRHDDGALLPVFPPPRNAVRPDRNAARCRQDGQLRDRLRAASGAARQIPLHS
ncbi:hypothetical protein [Shinella sp. JR1-6]|uniref:hypothetical protein n=1 Tax=Shinella sp. JR1-6 TaxID=2527671 RepID=UPI0014044991|nr:hypothetical protein [Shinella sp. JR1-6]